jgi:hypothetical protein
MVQTCPVFNASTERLADQQYQFYFTNIGKVSQTQLLFILLSSLYAACLNSLYLYLWPYTAQRGRLTWWLQTTVLLCSVCIILTIFTSTYRNIQHYLPIYVLVLVHTHTHTHFFHFRTVTHCIMATKILSTFYISTNILNHIFSKPNISCLSIGSKVSLYRL